MKLEDILKLGAMGFTKEDIMKLASGEGGETAVTKTADPEAKAPEAQTPETQEKEKAPENKEYEALKNELEEMKKLMQKQAIQNSTQPEKKTVDDMLTDLLKGL